MSRPSSDTLDRPTPRAVAADDLARPARAHADSERMPTLRGFEAVAEFAQTLGVPVVTARYVRQASQAHELPSFRVANKLCFSRADVREWLLSLRRD